MRKTKPKIAIPEKVPASLLRSGIVPVYPRGSFMALLRDGNPDARLHRDPAIHPVQPEPFTTMELAWLVGHLMQTTSPAKAAEHDAMYGVLRKCDAALKEIRR